MITTPQFPAPLVHGKTRESPKDFLTLQAQLSEMGFQFPKQVVVHDKKDLDQVRMLAFPVVAKSTDLTLLHKLKIGAVKTGIRTPEEIEQIFTSLSQWNGEVVFQETVLDGIQMLIGVRNDPEYGWYLAVGLGGSSSDALEDRSYCFLPASPSSMVQTLTRTKLFAALNHQQRIHVATFMMYLQEYALTTTGLKECEFNPVFITSTGHIIADMKRT